MYEFLAFKKKLRLNLFLKNSENKLTLSYCLNGFLTCIAKYSRLNKMYIVCNSI